MAHDPKRDGPRRWRGARIENSEGEPTLVGWEMAEDLSHEQVVQLRAQQQTYRVQMDSLRKLWILLVMVFLLSGSAMACVALHVIPEQFALALIGATVTPSLAAWALIVRWAFRRRGDGGG